MYNRFFILATTLLMMAACSSDKTLEEVDDITGHDNPMRFGTSGTFGADMENTTRAIDLEDGFKVTCWKSFDGNNITSLPVMTDYEVAYHPGDAQRWTYDDVRDQYLHYWDLSAYPYDFRACTPYLEDAHFEASGFSLNLSGSDRIFCAQTFLERQYNQDLKHSEPCLIAEVKRMGKDINGSYRDFDMLKRDVAGPLEINTNNNSWGVRDVHLPFHHLVSKVGFRLYIDDPEVPSYDITLSDVNISIVKDGFMLSSKQYRADNANGLLNGTFVQPVTVNERSLITKTEPYSDVNMANHLNKATAFDFHCPDDMIQLPQKELKIHARLTLSYTINGEPKSFDYDTLLSLDGENPAGDPFDWDPNTHYIYYLHLKNLEQYPIIVCTAEIVPWEIVQTSDIEIGL